MVTASNVVELLIQLRDMARRTQSLTAALDHYLEAYPRLRKTTSVLLSGSEAAFAQMLIEGVLSEQLNHCLSALRWLSRLTRELYEQEEINLKLEPLEMLDAVRSIQHLTVPVRVGSHFENYNEYSQLLAINLHNLRKQETESFKTSLAGVQARLSNNWDFARLDSIAADAVKVCELAGEALELAERHHDEALRLLNAGGADS